MGRPTDPTYEPRAAGRPQAGSHLDGHLIGVPDRRAGEDPNARQLRHLGLVVSARLAGREIGFGLPEGNGDGFAGVAVGQEQAASETRLLLGGLPLVTFPPYAPRLDTSPGPMAALGAAVVAAAIVLTIGTRSMSGLRRNSRPAILREQAQP